MKQLPTILLLSAGLLSACSKQEAKPTPPASKPPTGPTNPTTNGPSGTNLVQADFTLPTKAETTVAALLQNTSQDARRYKWTFGDGAADTTRSPSHTYAQAGTYAVTLRAYGAQGDSSVVSKNLTVRRYDLIAHSGIRVAGVYDCRVYTRMYYYPTPNSPGGPTVYTNLPNETLTFVQTAPDSLRLTKPGLPTWYPSIPGWYYPGSSLNLTNGPTLDFQMAFTRSSIASFYYQGDSLVYNEWSNVGHQSETYKIYRGKRRP